MTMIARDTALDPAADCADRRLTPVSDEPLTWEQWLAFDPGDEAGSYELVQGIPVMSPPESLQNLMAVNRLALLLAPVQGDFRWLAQAGIATKDEPAPTGRQADLVVIRTPAAITGSYLAGRDVLLAVEVVSSGSSDERDWVTKRAECAQAGVSAYLVVDRARGQLVLFDQTVDGVYSRRQDAAPEVTLEIGDHRIPVRLDQLLA